MLTETRRQIKDGVDIVKVAGDGDQVSQEGALLGSITYRDLQAIAEISI